MALFACHGRPKYAKKTLYDAMKIRLVINL